MNFGMNWELRIDGAVKKQLQRIPKKESRHLFMVIQELVVNPYAGDIEKMEGTDDLWRRRVGSYRIKYEINVAKKIIHVISAERRTSNTY